MEKAIASTTLTLALTWALAGCVCECGWCDGAHDSDSDTDTDTGSDTGIEADTDTGTDGEADTDTDAACGGIDEPCCDGESSCVEGTVAVDFGGGCDCYRACTPAACEDPLETWEDAFVPCGDVSAGEGVGACFASVDMEPIEEGCEDPAEPCVTASGYEDGICLFDGVDDYCMRRCEPGDDVCDLAHLCTPLLEPAEVGFTYVGGACIPKY